MYWNTRFRFDLIAQAMPRDRFYTLRVNIHFVDANAVSEEEKSANLLWKVQPVIDCVRGRCLEISKSMFNECSIDEQMIPFLGRCAVRQFVKNKPRPVGLKNLWNGP